MPRVIFSHEVEQFLAEADALIVRQDHEAAYTMERCAHMHFHDGDEGDWSLVNVGAVAAAEWAKCAA